ncbi:hypothetical protein S83_050424 [Arachis hypogaea]
MHVVESSLCSWWQQQGSQFIFHNTIQHYLLLLKETREEKRRVKSEDPLFINSLSPASLSSKATATISTILHLLSHSSLPFIPSLSTSSSHFYPTISTPQTSNHTNRTRD